jgi:hypothetical protein
VQIIGTPRWVTTGTTHYVYVALTWQGLPPDRQRTSLAPDSTGSWAGANNLSAAPHDRDAADDGYEQPLLGYDGGAGAR